LWRLRRQHRLKPAKGDHSAQRNQSVCLTLSAIIGGMTMQTFIGMILGALLLVCGVYIYDSMQTSSVASGNAQANRTIVNWDVAAAEWKTLKTRAHDDWIKISSK
jgi:hypothetical protein